MEDDNSVRSLTQMRLAKMSEESRTKYTIVTLMYQAGKIRSIHDIAPLLTRSKMAKDMGLAYTKFNICMNSPDEFNLRQLRRLSILTQIPFPEMIQLTENENLRGKKTKEEPYQFGK